MQSTYRISVSFAPFIGQSCLYVWIKYIPVTRNRHVTEKSRLLRRVTYLIYRIYIITVANTRMLMMVINHRTLQL